MDRDKNLVVGRDKECTRSSTRSCETPISAMLGMNLDLCSLGDNQILSYCEVLKCILIGA